MKKQEQDSIHTDYSQPITADVKREHTLHRVVALSAFVFALCILPVAQYILVHGTDTVAEDAAPEQGQVAGVSTESTNLAAVANNPAVTPTPTPANRAECLKVQAQDSADLAQFVEGKKKAMLSKYELAVAQLGSADAAGKESQEAKDQRAFSVQKLYENYMQELKAVEESVSKENEAITARVCPSE